MHPFFGSTTQVTEVEVKPGLSAVIRDALGRFGGFSDGNLVVYDSAMHAKPWVTDFGLVFLMFGGLFRHH